MFIVVFIKIYAVISNSAQIIVAALQVRAVGLGKAFQRTVVVILVTFGSAAESNRCEPVGYVVVSQRSYADFRYKSVEYRSGVCLQ